MFYVLPIDLIRLKYDWALVIDPVFLLLSDMGFFHLAAFDIKKEIPER